MALWYCQYDMARIAEVNVFAGRWQLSTFRIGQSHLLAMSSAETTPFGAFLVCIAPYFS